MAPLVYRGEERQDRPDHDRRHHHRIHPSLGQQFAQGHRRRAGWRLWFTEINRNRIGRITTAGVITEFILPTTNSWPSGIGAGPDGALWFTEYNGNKIGRITTGGVISEFMIPTANSAPSYITAGPDGALWFTEANANKIGRVTTGP